jgi:XTP/dITP diphosphohydrolase
MILRPPVEILIATHNRGKMREVHDQLHSLPVKLRYLGEFPLVSTVAELGKTYRENAVLKALGYARQTGLCALADDSGLEVDALAGAPGVHSARFGDENFSDHDRNQALLAMLSEQGDTRREASFICCMALAGWQVAAGAGEPQLLTVTQAKCDGSIALQARGSNGFGFDPLFVPEGYVATFAELPAEVKAKISHRAQALAAVRAFISCWMTLT